MRHIPANTEQAKELAEKFLSENGFNFYFIGCSGANGVSVYYGVGDFKVRFSDHGISNASRMENEITFQFGGSDFAINQSMLKLKFEMKMEGVSYGEISYTRFDGKNIKCFGYKTN